MKEFITSSIELIPADEAGALDFQKDGLCAQTDPEIFYPEKGGSSRAAKAVCRACVVRPECLDYALQNEQSFGVWGGMSERERRKITRGY